MRSLVLRIFLTLAIALTVISLAVVLVTLSSGDLPLTLPVLSRAFLADEMEASAETALALYQSGGAPAFSDYVRRLQDIDGTTVWLIDSGKDILGRDLPPRIRHALENAVSPGLPEIELHRFQVTAAICLENHGKPVTIAFERRSRRPLKLRLLLPIVAPRYLAGLLAALAFSYVLARLLAAPVEDLRRGMRQYAGGAAAVQLPSRLLARSDELGDLAREFDQMRLRIDGLLLKQQQLIADVSHELRSPLTRLAVALEIVRDSESREPEVLERMQREVAALENLIQQLLRLAALENPGAPTVIEPVSLGEVLGEAVGNAEFEAAKAGKSLSYDHPAEELFVEGDESLLASSMENILRNAVRYTPSHTAVCVTAAPLPDSEGVLVSIRDHGPGVPPDALDKIFAPFHRIGTARDRESGGVGLGLSIAERSIALCGGSIAAHNHPGGGLIVDVRLRRAAKVPARA